MVSLFSVQTLTEFSRFMPLFYPYLLKVHGVPETRTSQLNFFRGWLPPYLPAPFASLGEGHSAACTG